MSELKARYSRVPQGFLDVPHVSDSGRLLLAWVYQSPSRDVTPGLLRVGFGGLAEEIGWTMRKTRKAMDELSERVVVAEAERVMFVVGAIRHDPPRNVNTVIAMARQFSQIPTCEPRSVAATELEGSIENSDKSLKDKWRELNCSTNGSSEGSVNRRPPTPTPTPTPTPEDSAVASPRVVVTPADRTVDDNFHVIERLVHESFDELGRRADLVDVAEDVKARCAELGIAYSSAVVGRAVDSAHWNRMRKARAS
jgi:hypothetical protein